MPELSTREAAVRLADVVEKSKPSDLGEIYAEIFPEKAPSQLPPANDLARHIRESLVAEELVDLWNVVFPEDRNVWYDEESQAIHFNEEMAGYAD